MRLAWRGVRSRQGAARRAWIMGGVLLVMLCVGVGAGFGLKDWTPSGPVNTVLMDAVGVFIFTLMLSQTLASATEALYTRGDFDLLLSSPLPPRKLLFVRFLALGASAFVTFAIFIGPILLPVALIGHPGWLGAFVMLAALALAASASGLWLAMLLFRLIGPRRTRTVAQIPAAILGAIFFLTTQIGNILGGKSNSRWALLMQFARDHARGLPPAAFWFPDALMGSPIPLAGFTLGAGALFAGTCWALANRFVSDAAAASGAATPSRAPKGPTRAFAAGAFAATLHKEWRLLGRDPALMAQVLLRVLYVLPMGFGLFRMGGGGASLVLPGGAAVLCIMVGQVAASLAWITVSCEDAPGLIANAPVSMTLLRRAKLVAAFTPLAVLLAVPLGALIVLSPAVGVAATVGCVLSAWSSGLITAWHNPPAKRTDFRNRRAGGAWLPGLGRFIVSALIGATAFLAAMLWVWALIPAVLAALLMLILRRSDARVAAMMQAAA